MNIFLLRLRSSLLCGAATAHLQYCLPASRCQEMRKANRGEAGGRRGEETSKASVNKPSGEKRGEEKGKSVLFLAFVDVH